MFTMIGRASSIRTLSRFAAVAATTLAVLTAAAASSAPAFASTNVCRGFNTTYKSSPFTATMSGTLCNNGSGGSCPGGPHLSTSIPGWASPFVSITGVSGGCYFTSKHTESMWINIGIQVTDPLDPWVKIDGTVWLRAAEAANGTVTFNDGASLNLFSVL